MKILVGDEFGVVKCNYRALKSGVNTEKKVVESKFGETTKGNTVKSIKTLYANNNDIVSVLRENSFDVISWASKESFLSENVMGKEIVAQEVVQNELLSINVTGDSKGKLRLISFDEEINIKAEQSFEDSLSANLQKLRIYQGSELLAVFKNSPFTIYDINSNKVSFRAKNLPHDELDLKVDMFDTDILHLSNNVNAIYTTTAFGEIRFYDKKVKPRPILNKKVCDKRINCIIKSPCDNYVTIGDAIGRIQQLDIRKNFNCCRTYKGSTGAIKDLVVLNKNLIASCGLDRCLNVFNEKYCNVEAHLYLKTKLTCLTPIEVPEVEESQDEEEGEYGDENDEEGGELSDELDKDDESEK